MGIGIREGLAALLLLAGGATGTASFRYTRPVTLPAGASGQTCAALDAAALAHAGAGQAALRLYRNGQEVPYVLRTAGSDGGAVTASQKLEPLNLGRSGGDVTFDLEMPEGRYSDLDLDVDGKDFLATVTVTGSHDRSSTSQLAPVELGSFTIFDLSAQRLGRSTVLHLPQASLRALHLRVHGAAASQPLAPEAIRGVEVSAGAGITAAVPYTVVAAADKMEQKGKLSTASFTVSANVPVERVVFVPEPGKGNFSRDVAVKVEQTPEAQTALLRDSGGAFIPEPEVYFGSILRLHRVQDGEKVDEERLTVDVNAGGAGQDKVWHVTVQNGDDPPLALSEVRLETRERDVCFDALAGAGAGYALLYGAAQVEAPQYDYARLFAPVKVPVRAQLGAETLNEAYTPGADTRPFSERHPALLWAGLLVVLAVLGWVALRSARSGAA